MADYSPEDMAYIQGMAAGMAGIADDSTCPYPESPPSSCYESWEAGRQYGKSNWDQLQAYILANIGH